MDKLEERLLESLHSERAMLVAAIESLDRLARQATFGGWRHHVVAVTNVALQRADQCDQSRRSLISKARSSGKVGSDG